MLYCENWFAEVEVQVQRCRRCGCVGCQYDGVEDKVLNMNGLDLFTHHILTA